MYMSAAACRCSWLVKFLPVLTFMFLYYISYRKSILALTLLNYFLYLF
jgi:hypothetical protein